MPAEGGHFEARVFANVSLKDFTLSKQNLIAGMSIEEHPDGGFRLFGELRPNNRTTKVTGPLAGISISGAYQQLIFEQHYYYPVIMNMQSGSIYLPNTGSSDNYNIPVSVGPGTSIAIFEFAYRYSDLTLDPSTFGRVTIDNSAYAGSDYDRVVGLDQLYTVALTNINDPSVNGFHVLYNSDNALSTDYYRTFNVKYELNAQPPLNKQSGLFKFYLKITKNSG